MISVTKLISKREHFVDLFIIFLLGLVPLFWFKPGYLINGGDFTFPLDPQNTFFRQLYTWGSLSNSNSIDMDASQAMPLLFPYYFFLLALNYVGFSLITIEKLYFIFIFMLAGFSMYYLTSILNFGEYRRIAILVSTVYFMFNPYTLSWGYGNTIGFLAYGASPLILGLYIRALNSKKESFKYAVLFGIASLLFASTNANPPFVIAVIGIPITLYFFYYIFTNGINAAYKAIQYSIICLLLFILLNIWWILPMLNGLSEIKTTTVGSIGLIPPSFSVSMSFFEFIRAFGFWGWYLTYDGVHGITFAINYIDDIGLLVITFLFPVLAFSTLISRQKNKFILYFALIAILGIFLSKGVNRPLGEIYYWLFNNFPGFWIFRSPYEKFGGLIVLGFAFLMGIAAERTYDSIEKKTPLKIYPNIFLIIMICLILIASYPLLTGEVIQQKRGNLPSYHMNLPEYYNSAAYYINDNSKYDNLFFPVGVWSGYTSYVWGYSGGNNIIGNLFDRPKLIVDTSAFITRSNSLTMINYINDIIQNNKTDELGKILSFINVKYIILQNDVNWKFYGGLTKTYSPEYIKSFLNSQKDIHLERTFGELDIYENDYRSNHIFSTTNITYVKGNIESLMSIALSQAFNDNTLIFFSELLISQQQDEFIQDKLETNNSNNAVKITFTRINPTKYEVKVANATEPYFLTLSESYNPQWKAYINKESDETTWIESFFQQPVLEEKHLVANGYANSWYIDKLGTYDITLYYFPQNLFYIGTIVSLITFMFCVGYLVRYSRNKNQ